MNMKLKKFSKLFLIASILLIPVMVFASTGNDREYLGVAIFGELLFTPFVSMFVLKPLAVIFSKEKSKTAFWILFSIRVVILSICDFFIPLDIMGMDFLFVFVGTIIVLPICAAISSFLNYGENPLMDYDFTARLTNSSSNTNVELRCSKCNSILKATDKICSNCGEPFDSNNVVSTENGILTPANFDKIYSLQTEALLNKFINKELEKAGIDKNIKLIPKDLLERKRKLNIIFSFLMFIYISLIFFHFPIYTYVLGLIILVIFFLVTRSYSFFRYLKKQIKARPSEKISNIIMYEKNNLLEDDTKRSFTISLLVVIILPLIIFSTPKIFYEKTDGGYAVRFYTFGLTNFKTVAIPESYKNEKVVSLRGNTFSNMPFLEKVSLPDTIVEIRGQAFKNCKRLVDVNIPSQLEYLGGGAFYNAKSIKRIELPDTLTYLGGESFYGASSLEYIKLSSNMTQIKGNTFEYCTSLTSIDIPDRVFRIGGHAFYGDTKLSRVMISENSLLDEIGSSAFRQCNSLYYIIIPGNTYVNERAFKESPTSVNRYGVFYNTSASFYQDH